MNNGQDCILIQSWTILVCHLDKEGFLVLELNAQIWAQLVVLCSLIRLFCIFLTTKQVVNAGGSRFRSSITGTPFFNSSLWGASPGRSNSFKNSCGKLRWFSWLAGVSVPWTILHCPRPHSTKLDWFLTQCYFWWLLLHLATIKLDNKMSVRIQFSHFYSFHFVKSKMGNYEDYSAIDCL